VFVVFGAPYALAGFYDFLRGEWFDDLPNLRDILPHWLPSLWLTLAIAAFVIVTIEGSYRYSQRKVHRLEEQLAEQAKHKPIFAMTSSVVKQSIEQKTKTMVIQTMVTFTNIGDSPAYQVTVRRCYATTELPSKTEKQPLLTMPSAVSVGGNIAMPFNILRPLVKRDAIGSRALLLYCNILCSDSAEAGRQFEHEEWFAYPINSNRLAYMKQEQKAAFEPFVRQAYSS
jgi:hypothetical protein